MTNEEAEKIINMEHDIDILEEEFYEFTKKEHLVIDFHNIIVFLDKKGIVKTKND